MLELLGEGADTHLLGKEVTKLCAVTLQSPQHLERLHPARRRGTVNVFLGVGGRRGGACSSISWTEGE